jgi:glycosyltransferase involved in cell wall biosynthesis
MRIAFLCPSFGEYGGIGRIANALGTEFRAAGHELALVCRPGAPQAGAWAGVPRLEIPMHQLPRRWRHLARQGRLLATLARTLPRLRTFLRQVDADVLLVLGISTYAPLALAASRWLPVVVSLQGGEPDGRFAAHPRLFRALLARAAGVTACATSLAREAQTLEPRVGAVLEVVPNGVEPARFAAASPHQHPRPYLLAAGRFTRQKGFDVLLAAAARLDGIRGGGTDLLLAGDGGEDASLQRQAGDLGLERRVIFLGAVDAEGMASLYRGARVVAVPSRWEGLPLVCLEAMASGRPVVASAVDGIPDAVSDRETGLLVPPDDPQALATALDALLADPGWAERLGAAGARRAADFFAWPGIARQYLSVFARAARTDRS